MDHLYSLLVRISLETAGFAAAAGGVLRLFSQMEQQALASEAAVGRLSRAYSAMASSGQTNTAAFVRVQGQMADAVTANVRAQERLSAAQRAGGQLIVGAALTGAGLAGVGVMKSWVGAAQEVQDALAGVGLATHRTQTQLEQMGLPQLAYRVASQTQFSAPDVLRMAQLAATGGINDPRVLMNMLPTLAKTAEISNRLKGTSIDESIPALVSIAHQFQAYGAQPGMTPQAAAAANRQLQALAGRVAQAQVVSNLTPSALEHSLGYLTSAHAGLGLSPEQAIEFTAFASNVGLTGGQGGGARLREFFQRLAGGAVRRTAGGRVQEPLQNQYLHALERRGGGTFFDAQGQFEGVGNAFAIIEKAAASYGQNQQARLVAFRQAFGASGSMIATVGSTPEAQQRMHQLAQTFAEDPTAFVERSQKTLNQTLSGQIATLQSNFGSLAAMIGTDLLPPVIAVTHALVEFTSGVMTFATQYPVLVHAAAAITALGTAASLIVGPLLAVRGAMALVALASRATAAAEVLAAAGGVGAGVAGGAAAAGAGAGVAAGGAGLLGGVLGTLAGLAGVLLPIAAGAAGVYLILTRWKGAMDAAHIAWLGLGDIMQGVGGVVGALGDAFSGVGPQLGGWLHDLGQAGLFQTLGSAAHAAALHVEQLTRALQAMTPHPTAHAALGGAAVLVDPNARLGHAAALLTTHPDPRLPGSTVTVLPPTSTMGAAQIFGGTVGISGPLPPVHLGDHHVHLHVPPGHDPHQTQHIVSVVRTELEHHARTQADQLRDLMQHRSLLAHGVPALGAF